MGLAGRGNGDMPGMRRRLATADVRACPRAYHVFVWADSLCMTIDSPMELCCHRCIHGGSRQPKPSRRKWSVASLVRKNLPTKIVRFVGLLPAGLAPGENTQNSLDSPFTPGQLSLME